MSCLLDLIKKRKSIRNYSNKNISEKDLLTILEAARLAPSAKNKQNWKFIVIKDKNIIKNLIEPCKGQQFVSEADIVIAGCSDVTDYVMTCGQHAYSIDLSIAIEHMVLMAAELGIGSCWIGAFYEDKVKKLLNIPENVRIVSLLTLGYPKEEIKSSTTRKELSEIISYNKW